MSFKVTVKNRAQVLQALARADKRIVVAVAQAVADGAKRVQAQAQTRAPVDTGALRASINVELTTLKDGTPAAKIGSKLFYARFVEFGTRASRRGQVVLDGSGANWAKNKRSKRKRIKGFKVRVAGRSHPGTRAKPFLFPAYRSSKKAIVKSIGDAVARGAKA